MWGWELCEPWWDPDAKIERNTGTSSAKTLQFAQELTEELIMDLGGVEGPNLPSIQEVDEDSDDNSVDSAQGDFENIFREPHEFTHPIPAYQVLLSQSNTEAEQTLGLVHSEQSLRNAKASMASAFIAAIDESEEDFDEVALEDSSVDEGVDWISMDFYIAKDIQREVKDQYKKEMKEPMIEDPLHKKLASFYMDNIKLNRMQLVGLHWDMKSMQDMVEETKGRWKDYSITDSLL